MDRGSLLIQLISVILTETILLFRGLKIISNTFVPELLSSRNLQNQILKPLTLIYFSLGVGGGVGVGGGTDNEIATKLYHKRDEFRFHIRDYTFLCGNIESSPSYSGHISQLIRYGCCCSYYDDSKDRPKILLEILLSLSFHH